jgi:hypothetical protein
MDDRKQKILEDDLRQWSQAFPYPPTPDIADAVIRKLNDGNHRIGFPRWRLVWGSLIILLLITLASVPQVRAQVLEFLQIGAVRIFLREPAPTSTHTEMGASSQAGENDFQLVTATPLPPISSYPSISDLAGETTLEKARGEIKFPIRLPTYPSDLGQPDRVFLQDLGGPAVLLLWMEPGQPERITMNLLIMGPGSFAQKGRPTIIMETTVNGKAAIWTEGSHFLHLDGSMYQTVPLVVDGHILIWENEGLTYRLETDLTIDQAVKIAETLE